SIRATIYAQRCGDECLNSKSRAMNPAFALRQRNDVEIISFFQGVAPILPFAQGAVRLLLCFQGHVQPGLTLQLYILKTNQMPSEDTSIPRRTLLDFVLPSGELTGL